MAVIKIWAPKYSTNEVLIAGHKIGQHNFITFTKAKHLEGKEFYIAGDTVRKYPTQRNGRGYVYVVPFDELELYDE